MYYFTCISFAIRPSGRKSAIKLIKLIDWCLPVQNDKSTELSRISFYICYAKGNLTSQHSAWFCTLNSPHQWSEEWNRALCVMFRGYNTLTTKGRKTLKAHPNCPTRLNSSYSTRLNYLSWVGSGSGDTFTTQLNSTGAVLLNILRHVQLSRVVRLTTRSHFAFGHTLLIYYK